MPLTNASDWLFLGRHALQFSPTTVLSLSRQLSAILSQSPTSKRVTRRSLTLFSFPVFIPLTNKNNALFYNHMSLAVWNYYLILYRSRHKEGKVIVESGNAWLFVSIENSKFYVGMIKFNRTMFVNFYIFLMVFDRLETTLLQTLC